MTKTGSLQDTQIAQAIKKKKTNTDWYRVEKLGSYFKFEEGVLLQCPMNTDGTRDTNPCEVDWKLIEDDEVDNRSLRAVAQVLAANP
jgi:hypothetical protein